MYFPVFLDISDKCILLIGSGNVAKRKLSSLLQYTKEVTVITTDKEYMNDNIHVIHKAYDPSLLSGASIVIAATDSSAVNSRIAADCKERGILCDVSVHPEEGDFIFPGIVKRGSLTIAVSTDGKCPALAGKVRRDLEEILPGHLDSVAERAEEYRKIISDTYDDSSIRREVNRKVAEALVETNGQITDEEINKLINSGES